LLVRRGGGDRVVGRRRISRHSRARGHG
jgi:hypothetical protein